MNAAGRAAVASGASRARVAVAPPADVPRSAIAGAAAWGLLVAGGAGRFFPFGQIEALLAFAPLVVMPLAMELRARVVRDLTASDALGTAKGDRLAVLDRAVRSLVLPGALFAAASFVLPPGRTAAYVASPWIVVCALIALGSLARAAAPLIARRRSFVEWALLAASAAYLPVGAIWLVLSRLGVPIAGFLLPIPTLTGIHFHYTMFALPTIAAATGVALRGGTAAASMDAFAGAGAGAASKPLSRAWPRFLFVGVAIVLVVGPAMLLSGWILRFIPLKLLATLLLAAATAGHSLILFVLSPRLVPSSARGLLRIAATAVVAAMALAVVYGAGEYFERAWISIPRMAQLHGVLNAFGFTLCGLLGWLLMDRSGASGHRGELRS